ncbi:MAG: hypothetical protein OXC40_06665 [Proteobacteria bacterium]|nr:hypothetical protein [Pseudomonadota bacterium]
MPFVNNFLEGLLKKAQGRRGGWILFWVAFFESTVLIFPIEIAIIALQGVSKYRWYILALIATIGSVLGGVSGYFLGVFAWESFAIPLLELLGVNFSVIDGRQDIAIPSYIYETFAFLSEPYLFQAYAAWSSWIVVFFALTPFPFRLVTMTSGAAGTHLGIFILAVFLARGLRFFIVSWLAEKFSDHIFHYLKRYSLLVFLILMTMVLVFILWKFLGKV